MSSQNPAPCPDAGGSLDHPAVTPSADHVLRELLGAPHLAAHEGRKTAADDRAHRDEGGTALHEPRKLSNLRNEPGTSVFRGSRL